MAHEGGNVEPPCPFRSICRTNSGSYFLGTPASSALAWVTASQKISSTFSLDTPDHLDLRHPGQFPAHHRRLGQRVAGPPLLADGEVIEPFALVGVTQRPATLGDRHARPPLRAPVGAVVDGRRGTGLPFLHLNRLNRGNTVVVLGEPVRLVAVEVDPFDAVALAATRRDHEHRRHRRPPSPLVGFSLTAPRRPRPTNRRDVGEATGGNPRCQNCTSVSAL